MDNIIESNEYFSIFFILILVREKLIEQLTALHLFQSHADWYV